jgi:hypothetical protein
MKIHTLNTFHSNDYVFIIVDMLGSAKKYRLYVNSLIAARKQRGRKKKKSPKCTPLRIPKGRIPSSCLLGNTQTNTFSFIS